MVAADDGGRLVVSAVEGGGGIPEATSSPTLGHLHQTLVSLFTLHDRMHARFLCVFTASSIGNTEKQIGWGVIEVEREIISFST